MEQPKWYIQSENAGLVCKLHKVIYGLKQTPRVWYEKLKLSLIKLGYKSTRDSLYIKNSEGKTAYKLVYVDDVLITGSNEKEISNAIQHLNHTFSVKDLDDLNYFLGIEVIRNDDSEIILRQKKYIAEILVRAKINAAKTLPTPMATNLHPSKNKGEHITNDKQYRSIIEALQYLTIT